MNLERILNLTLLPKLQDNEMSNRKARSDLPKYQHDKKKKLTMSLHEDQDDYEKNTASI